jgi:RNA polymerase sigma factor (sigma-70 family)
MPGRAAPLIGRVEGELDPSTMRQELETLHPASLAWALGCCEWNPEEAREVLQSAYLKIFEGQARFDGRSSLKTWFFSVIRRTASERRRRGWLRILGLERYRGSDPEPIPVDGPEKAAGQKELEERVRAAVSRLSTRQREVVQLVFYHDLTVEEAARAMDVSVGTARVHYDRGKKELARLLGQRERADGGTGR